MANLASPGFSTSNATLDSVEPMNTQSQYNSPKHGSPVSDAPQTNIHLRPIATPAALGLASWSSAAFVVGAFLAGWFGDDATVARIWPFVLTFGGLGGFAAGMWSFNARDTLGSVLHTLWGGFWLSIALSWGLSTIGANAVRIDRWGMFDNFAIWLVPIAAFTLASAWAIGFRELLVASIYANAGIGAILAVIGWFVPSKPVLHVTAYLWLASSLLSLYRVWVYFMHESTRNDKFLPLFRTRRGVHLADGRWTEPYREPGVTRGC